MEINENEFRHLKLNTQYTDTITTTVVASTVFGVRRDDDDDDDGTLCRIL